MPAAVPSPDRGATARLVEVQVADLPDTWAAAGFAVDGDRVHVGATSVHLAGPGAGAKGVTRWTVAGLIGPDLAAGSVIDGLPTVFVPRPAEPAEAAGSAPPAHPNGVTGIDHVVVLTPALDRTVAALGAVGLACRRIRDTTSYGSPMRQAFFRLGPTVLEVVSGDAGTGLPAAEAPATWFGLAFDVDDLDRTAAFLGDGMGAVRAAVQDGRRIATLRHKTFGMSVAVAVMDHHAGR